MQPTASSDFHNHVDSLWHFVTDYNVVQLLCSQHKSGIPNDSLISPFCQLWFLRLLFGFFKKASFNRVTSHIDLFMGT